MSCWWPPTGEGFQVHRLTVVLSKAAEVQYIRAWWSQCHCHCKLYWTVAHVDGSSSAGSLLTGEWQCDLRPQKTLSHPEKVGGVRRESKKHKLIHLLLHSFRGAYLCKQWMEWGSDLLNSLKRKLQRVLVNVLLLSGRLSPFSPRTLSEAESVIMKMLWGGSARPFPFLFMERTSNQSSNADTSDVAYALTWESSSDLRSSDSLNHLYHFLFTILLPYDIFVLLTKTDMQWS